MQIIIFVVTFASVSRFAWSEDAAIDENMDARAPNAASGPFLAKTGPAQGATRS